MRAMNAVQTASAPALTAAPVRRLPTLGILRAALLTESVLMLVLTIFLSLLAAALRDSLGGEAGRSAEVTLRFAAAAVFVVAILAAVASRGARLRRRWTVPVVTFVQLAMLFGTLVAMTTAAWHPLMLLGVALPAAVMLLVSTGSASRELSSR